MEKFCPCRNHPGYSNHPKNKVPLELFRKDKNDPNSVLFKFCTDCRIESGKQNKKSQANQRKKLKETKRNEDKTLGFLFCSCLGHTSYSGYPRGEVPVDMFRQQAGNNKSILFDYCSDCRSFCKNGTAKMRKKREDSVSEGEFFARFAYLQKSYLKDRC